MRIVPTRAPPALVLWVGGPMRPHEHDRMFRAETEHFWFVGTRGVILTLLRNALGPRVEHATLLDMGCGTGYTLSRLPRGMRAVGLDYSEHALTLAERRAPGVELVRGSAYHLPFADGAFDAVLALDVLEHLDDDQRAAREIARVLAPGGVAVVAVPAVRWLWSDHDVALEHRRRYHLPELEVVLEQAELHIEHSSYYNTLLFPLVAARRLSARIWSPPEDTPRSDLVVPPGPINRSLSAILAFERFLVPRVKLPFGVSCFAIARR
ncbi:MAG TPA: class I SAM-dependent methyltransferase [Sandaracinaceae bacterium LLY-WYZ-13_1]|nr:class I SAM-dependent methyltransferase [Sandaracinaceae bacterium LLY-WYZ-13_1]